MPHSNYSEVGDRLTGELSGTRPKDWLTSESRASSSGQRTTSTPAAAMLLAAGDIESTARSLGVWSLGSLGYMRCAAEILQQSNESGVGFDHIVHCTGSSSTQAGLLAGFAYMGQPMSVIGVADDDETDIKRARVLELANSALALLGSTARVAAGDVEIIAADPSDYGQAEPQTFDLIRKLASTEGIVADPVYEGKALRGLGRLIADDRFDANARILLMHLGGTPAVHAYANQFGAPVFKETSL